MKTSEEYRDELLGRLTASGMENSVLADGLYRCGTASELLDYLRLHMNEWVLDFKVSGAELEEVFSQKRLRDMGIFTGDQKVTVNETGGIYVFGGSEIEQKGDLIGHYYEHSIGRLHEGKGRFYQYAQGSAYNFAMIFAHHEANVIAADQAQLTLMDNARGILYQQCSGLATGTSTLICHDCSYAFLTGHSTGVFQHSSMGQCEGNSSFIARHTSDIEAYGHSTGKALERATLSLAEQAKVFVSPDYEGTIHQSNRTAVEIMSPQVLSELLGVGEPRQRHLSR